MYVGTPSFSGNSTYTLASIIQGEAGGEGLLGQQAVASVIANRAAVNLNGYGTSLTSQALAPNQFQGQATPTAQSMMVAQQLEAGQISDPTNGALYYANPGNSSGPLAGLNSSNSLQIGNHYFSDQYGPASQNYMNGISSQSDAASDAAQDGSFPNSDFTPDLNSGGIASQGSFSNNNLPTFVTAGTPGGNPTGVYDGSNGATPYGTIQGGADQAPSFTMANQGAVTGDIASQGTGSDYNTISPSGIVAQNTGTGDLSDGLYAAGASSGASPVADAGTPATAGSSPTAGLPGPLQTILGGPQSAPSSTPSTGGGILSGMWEMLGVTAVTSAGAQESQAITSAASTTAQATTSAATQTNQTSAQDTASTNATNQGIASLAAMTLNTDTNAFLDNGKDIFVRAVIAFFGLILLAGAVLYFMKKQDLIPVPV